MSRNIHHIETINKKYISKNKDNKDNKHNTQKNNTCLNETSCMFGGCISIFAFIVSYISYLVFGILFLVQDYTISHNCDGSVLWVYVLISIIFSCIKCRNVFMMFDNEGETNICILICSGFIDMCFSIWGGIELFNKSCSNLIGINLWKFGLANFILQIFVASICLIIIPLNIYCLIKSDEKENEIDDSKV